MIVTILFFISVLLKVDMKVLLRRRRFLSIAYNTATFFSPPVCTGGEVNAVAFVSIERKLLTEHHSMTLIGGALN